MELFEQIRREDRFGVGTIQGVAKKLETHRQMVPQALASAIPPERKTPVRSQPKLGPVRDLIDEILQTDHHGGPTEEDSSSPFGCVFAAPLSNPSRSPDPLS